MRWPQSRINTGSASRRRGSTTTWLGLRVGLADVRISAQGKQPPFFEADYVAVTVPRRTLLGDVALDDVAVTNGVVRIVRSAAGEANLPDSAAAAEGEPAPLRIGHLLLSPLRRGRAR